MLPRPLPTPVLAFAIRHLGVDAGVMVTASHNPPQDNGYKVYLGDGSQIVPPADARDRRAASRRSARCRDVPLADDGWVTLGDDVLDAYLDAAAAVVHPESPRDLSVVHTPLHGVGRDVLVAALERAGFADAVRGASQGDPDPDFPTVAFPNPEEPGAIDAALDAARERGADVVLANDPDADRCAVAVPDAGGRGRLADAHRRRGRRAARRVDRAPLVARGRRAGRRGDGQLDRVRPPARRGLRGCTACGTSRR